MIDRLFFVEEQYTDGEWMLLEDESWTSEDECRDDCALHEARVRASGGKPIPWRIVIFERRK